MSLDNNYREYMIFNVEELPLIDFNEVLETSPSTLRISLDGNKTFVKWIGPNIPSCISLLTTKEGPYNNDEIFVLMKSSEWQKTNPDI